MNLFRRVLRVALLIVFCSFASFAASKPQHRVESFSKYVEMPGATRLGSEACSTCHADIGGGYRHAFHAQQGVDCEDCHGAGSLHVEGGGDVDKIIRIAKRPYSEANGVCLSCHVHNEWVRNWMSGSHASNHLRCTECHQIHVVENAKTRLIDSKFDARTRGNFEPVENLVPEAKVKIRSRSETVESCLKCHQTQRGQISLPYHHPLREGKMACVDCHDPHGGPGEKNLRVANVNQLCLRCHAQYRGPFAYQHPPVNENCLNCHSPHGSANTNLLKVSEPALCLQCHAGHHNGSSLPLADRCTDCHGSIHGSDVATATGGSRFIDKGPWGVPKVPSQPLATGPAALTPSHSRTGLAGGGLVASHVSTASAALAALGSSFGLNSPSADGEAQTSSSAGPELPPGQYSAYSITPGAYRFVDTSGFAGRVGEYDSLQQSAGAEMESAYVTADHQLVLVTRGDVITGNDYRFASQLAAQDHFQAGIDLRSFVQQQDTYPFYSAVISPDITVSNGVPNGAVYGITRRIGSAYARAKLPRIPVRVFVKGDWQARSGMMQFRYLDEGGDASCGSCHYNSQYQRVNFTTRNVGGGADITLGSAQLTVQHDQSSFNDRLTFPVGTYGAMLNEVEPGPVPVPSTQPGNYYLDIPSPNTSATDTLNLNWAASDHVVLRGNVSYSRLKNNLTQNPQNIFNTDESLSWRPVHRLRMTFDYHQYNLINDFKPFYNLYGNVSEHQRKAGMKIDYELTTGLNLETYYRRGGVSRSSASLWPQIYSINNTDLLRVVPSSASNTAGLALRYHHGSAWSARAGYEWTGTHQPGFLIVPGSNNRVFASVTMTPYSWLMFSNDTDVLVQNAFPTIRRSNRIYSNTLSATLRFVPEWDLQLGHSYQQNNLNTYMAFQNDASAGYVLDVPQVPYRQISQTYWGQSSYRFAKRFGLTARVSYNSARSGMRPSFDANNPALYGNGSLIQQNAFDPVLFAQALDTIRFSSTQVSEVIVPEWVGQSKAYYLFPRKFTGGVIFYYGSYRDYWNPNLNGVLRSFNLYVGRTW